jgi:hypothetical protein
MMLLMVGKSHANAQSRFTHLHFTTSQPPNWVFNEFTSARDKPEAVDVKELDRLSSSDDDPPIHCKPRRL